MLINCVVVQWKVPQNVDRDDEILPYLTVKQLFILAFGIILGFTLFSQITSLGIPFEIAMAFAAIPVGFAWAVGYVNYGGVTFLKFFLLFIEAQLIPRKRIWRHSPFLEKETLALISLKETGPSVKQEKDHTKAIQTIDDLINNIRVQEHLSVDHTIDDHIDDEEQEHYNRINTLYHDK